MEKPKKRAQRLINLVVDPQFLEAIDKVSRMAGYADRSTFIREAIYEKMAEKGAKISREISLPPSRSGVGGKPSHKRKYTINAPGGSVRIVEDYSKKSFLKSDARN